MRRVRFSALALADLEDIAEYIGRDNQGAARRAINRIEEIIFSLCDFPDMGVPSEVAGARKLFVPGLPYKIVYQSTKKTAAIVILRVYHGARNIRY